MNRLFAYILLIAMLSLNVPGVAHANEQLGDALESGLERSQQALERTGEALERSSAALVQDATSGAERAADIHLPDAPIASKHERTELLQLVLWEMVWTIVIFLGFFALLAFGVWPKILGALKGREEKQLHDLRSAEMAAKEAQTTLEQYRQQLADARKEAQQIIEQSRKDAQMIASQLKADTEKDIATLRKQAHSDIHSAKEQAVSELADHAAELATLVAGKILGREISPQEHRELIQKSVNQNLSNDLGRN